MDLMTTDKMAKGGQGGDHSGSKPPLPDSPPLGAHVIVGGVRFAVFSDHAEAIEVCLFDAAGTETARHALQPIGGGIWQGAVEGIGAGALYGLRAHGPYAPEDGHQFNPAKLLLDPYARALSGGFIENPALYGSARTDSAPFMPKCVVTDDTEAPAQDTRPRRPLADSVIYEAHIKGISQQFPGLAAGVAGTADALADPAMIDHLQGLGITALELLPIHALKHDAFLLKRGLRNYWGYNTAAFFAPEPSYLGANGRAGLRSAIAALHQAGIEVILDVVYNHTAEGDEIGPTLSFRGLDNASYYRLQDDRRLYVNDTGCGNTLNTAHPMVARMVMDSLRHWVEAYGIDGFRFDLAPVLGRGADGRFDADAPLLQAMRQDPVLADVKLIAEPWDIGPGGYQLGGFPPEFAEWNDRFRDDVRQFWRADAGGAPALAGRLMGSADVFDVNGRRASSSINLITAHDGFTLHDLTAYADKHNQANGENNRDGHGHNISDNMGAEGSSEDPNILQARALRQRNFLSILMFAQGTPMLLAGDEVGNSQDGNNNAYCQDGPLGWIDWQGLGGVQHRFTRRLIALRKAHPALRQAAFVHGEPAWPDGPENVVWLAFDGDRLNWDDPALRRFALRLRCPGDDVILAVNGSADAGTLGLPADTDWRRDADSIAPDAPPAPAVGAAPVAAHSVVLFAGAGGGDV